jgi:hypothetical protein
VPELHAAVKQLLSERGSATAAFFERGEKESVAPASVGFRALFASVPRRLGGSAELAVDLPADLRSLARPHWTRTDLARLWLLLRGLSGVAEAEQAGWLLALFEAGEIGEQVSMLRTLSALPEPARFVETGEQACRHNSLDVFEAIVAENPFLAAHFPALSFNQAVMKAIFQQVSVRRIEQLEQRITPELSRMAAGYASERRAAGRPVPEDAEFLAHYGAK